MSYICINKQCAKQVSQTYNGMCEKCYIKHLKGYDNK